MTNSLSDGKLPTWAKVLIGFVIAAVVCSIIGIGVLIFAIQHVFKQAQDPKQIARVAQQIAVIDQPLPPGYKYVFGFGMAGINTISIQHAGDEQLMIIISYPATGKEDAKDLVDKLYTNGQFQEVKSKGTEVVGGESMPYIIGVMSDKTGAKFEGLVSCIVSKDKQKSLLIYGIEPPGSPYKMDVTDTLLKTIKSF